MSTLALAMPEPRARRHAVIAVVVAAAAYLVSFLVLMRTPGASAAEPLFLLGVLGLGFPLLAYALTRRPRALPAAPARPLAPVLAYLAAFAVLVLGWGFSALNAAVPGERAHELALLALKLATMVLLPAALFLRGERLAPRATARRLLGVFVAMALAYLAFQAVFGRGLANLRELSPAPLAVALALPACFAWQALEAGLCEEVLFRRVLQQRLADATRSQVAAVAWASLLFGLAHAPGLWLRGAHLLEGVGQATPGWALAYSVVTLAPAGIAFGVLWARTRSLWLLVPLHGVVDLLPQLAPFIRTWLPMH